MNTIRLILFLGFMTLFIACGGGSGGENSDTSNKSETKGLSTPPPIPPK